MKAVRSIELGLDTLNLPKLKGLTTDEIEEKLHNTDDERLFVVYEAFKRGVPLENIFRITKIDRWFLSKIQNLAGMERDLMIGRLTPDKYKDAKDMGFLDSTIEYLSGQKPPLKLPAAFKMVDTCAAEFEAQTPYFYATFDEENEAMEFIKKNDKGKKKIMVFGSGPIRIGQGIEFDYCSVHCINAIRERGYEAIIVNNKC